MSGVAFSPFPSRFHRSYAQPLPSPKIPPATQAIIYESRKYIAALKLTNINISLIYHLSFFTSYTFKITNNPKASTDMWMRCGGKGATKGNFNSELVSLQATWSPLYISQESKASEPREHARKLPPARRREAGSNFRACSRYLIKHTCHKNKGNCLQDV